MGLDSPSHWAIVAVVVLVLFGYKKLPEMSRSVGRSLRIFKTEMKGMSDDDSAREAVDQTAVNPPPVQPPVAGAVPPVPAAGDVAPPAVHPAPAAETPREAPQQQAQG